MKSFWESFFWGVGVPVKYWLHPSLWWSLSQWNLKSTPKWRSLYIAFPISEKHKCRPQKLNICLSYCPYPSHSPFKARHVPFGTALLPPVCRALCPERRYSPHLHSNAGRLARSLPSLAGILHLEALWDTYSGERMAKWWLFLETLLRCQAKLD
jgi:hypothetical protein